MYTVIDSTTVTANLKVDGQTNGGNAFPDGGGLIINPSGGLIQSISVSLSGKSFSISVTPGRISTTPKATDVYVEFPKDSIRRYVYCMRDYLVEYLFVEEYRGTELISTFYTTRTTLLGTTWYTKPA